MIKKGFLEFEEFKINIQEKIKKNNESQTEKIILLGEEEIQPVVYEYLIEETHEYFRIKKGKYGKKIFRNKNDEITLLTFTLVYFAKYDYKTDFWNEFFKTIHSKKQQDKMEICQGSFKKYCKKNHLFFNTGGKNNRYRDSILTHAIFTKSDTEKVFHFIDRLYTRFLNERCIEDDIDRLFAFLNTNFEQYLEHDEFILEYKKSKFTISNQMLSKPFRLAFINSFYVKNQIKRLLFIENAANFGEISSIKVETSLEENYIKHLNEKEKARLSRSKNLIKNTIKTKNVKIGKYSKQPRYQLEGNQLYLIIPPQKDIPKSLRNLDLFFELFTKENEVISTHKVNILDFKDDLFYETEDIKIKVENYYPDLRCVLKGATFKKILKPNNDSNYIFFDIAGQQISETLENQSEMQILSLFEEAMEFKNIEYQEIKHNNYKITTVFLSEESELYIDNKLFSTQQCHYESEVAEEDKVKGANIFHLMQDHKEEEAYEVFKALPEIILRTSSDKQIEDFILVLNGENKELSKVCFYDTVDITDGSGEKAFIVNLDGGFIKSQNPLKIKIYDRESQKTLIKRNMIIVDVFNFKFDKNFYINYKEIESSPKVILEELNYRIGELENLLKNPVSLDLKSHTRYSEKFQYEGKEYKLIINIPFLTWNFEGTNSTTIKKTDIWYDENTQKQSGSLIIDSPVPIAAFIKNNERIKLRPKASKVYKINVGYIVENTEFAIEINSVKYPLFTLYAETTMINPPLISYNNKNKNNGISGLNIRIDAIGDEIIFLDILEKNNEFVKRYKFDKNTEIIHDPDIFLKNGSYQFEFYCRKESYFSGVVKRILHTKKFNIGKSFQIWKVKHCYCYINSCSREIQKYTISNFYLKVNKYDIDEKMIKADAFFYKLCNQIRKKYYFEKYNPINLEICPNFKNRYYVSDKNNDGLIYDSNTGYINKEEAALSHNELRYKIIEFIDIELAEEEKHGVKSNKGIKSNNRKISKIH
ncbi:MAG TPA: hypothetical protein PLB99_01535 [Thermotogota bacterium]|nr:hypothetical protein [Thermotogota bacterium]